MSATPALDALIQQAPGTSGASTTPALDALIGSATTPVAAPAASAAPQPGAVASLGAGLGHGFGEAVLGLQRLLGQGAQAASNAPDVSGVLAGTSPQPNTIAQGGNWLVSDANQGLQRIGKQYQPYASAHPVAAEVGNLGGQIAGTYGVGGALAAPFRLAALEPVATALETGGFRTGLAPTSVAGRVGAAALRSAAGGAVGGASSAILDPQTAGAGALIGAAVPLAGQFVYQGAKGIAGLTGGLLTHTLGSTTGAGANAIGQAFQAGRQGNQAFLDAMRGATPLDDVVSEAKTALGNLRDARNAEYQAARGAWNNDPTVLNFQPIQGALQGIQGAGKFAGMTLRPKSAGLVDELTNYVNNWANADPTIYHTPAGLDALKQGIWDLGADAKPNTEGSRAVGQMYNAVKQQVSQQAPSYAGAMNDYAHASDQINEIQKGLSLGNKTAKDTALRKLQSVLRNNVQTNYGNRLSMVQALQDAGAPNLIPQLAGHSLGSWTPRGMTGALEKGGLIAALVHPQLLAAAPFTSPRLMGEAAYGLGRAAGGVGGLTTPLSLGMNRGLAALPDQSLSLLTLGAPAIYRAVQQ